MPLFSGSSSLVIVLDVFMKDTGFSIEFLVVKSVWSGAFRYY